MIDRVLEDDRENPGSNTHTSIMLTGSQVKAWANHSFQFNLLHWVGLRMKWKRRETMKMAFLDEGQNKNSGGIENDTYFFLEYK